MKYFQRIPVFGILLLVPVIQSFGQYWNLKKIDNDDGLSNSAVTSIFLDTNGYMWLGTWDGLNRYDGTALKVFKPDQTVPNSISNNIIRAVFEDPWQVLWVVTDKEINKYNADYQQFEVFFDQTNSHSTGEQIIKSSISKDSTLWCSVYGLGVASYSQSENKFHFIESNNQLDKIITDVAGMAALADDRLVLLSRQGQLAEIEQNNGWRIKKIIDIHGKYDILSNLNWFFYEKNEATFFVALDKGGFLVIDLVTGEEKIFSSSEAEMLVTTVSQSTSGNFYWIGTDEGKIFKWTPDGVGKLENLDHEFPNLVKNKVKILSIYETKPDLLWIGTDGNGVIEYNTRGSAFVSIKKGNTENGELGHDIVRAIYEDEQGLIWIGTRGNGLNILYPNARKTKIINAEQGLSNNAVLSINQDHNKNYWIGTDGEGIDMMEGVNGKIYHFPRDFVDQKSKALNFKSVYAICVDSYGDIWLGTSGHGIIKLTVKKNGNGTYSLETYKQFLNIPNEPKTLKSNIVYAIAEDHENALWIGSRGGGLQKLNTVTNKFEEVDNSIDKDVISLQKTSRGLWVGTSNGLYRIDHSSDRYEKEYYGISDGLPNSTVHAILEDRESNIWLSTNNGLSKWDRTKKIFKNYTKNDGLQSNEYSDGAAFIDPKSGKLYFGGVKGLTMFHPEKVRESDYFPELVMQELRLFNKSIVPLDNSGLLKRTIDNTDTLVLSHDQNFFSIDFTTLNYQNKEKCRYAYYLKNFDKDWNYVGSQSTASFTNVPPGNYLLQLKNTNESGIWNDQISSIRIIIKPPYWETPAAYLVYAILAALVIYLVVYVIKRRTLEHRQLYIERLERRKAEDINNYKLRFFTNITHEFRTPLSLILVPATKLIENKKNHPELAQLFDNIYENANRLLKLIGELIEFRKAETGNILLEVHHGDINKFVYKITTAFEQYAAQHKIKITFSNKQVKILSWFDNEKVEKIMLNLISNAIKYTPEYGTINVSVEKTDEFIKLWVSDSGIGMAKDILGKIFDRFYNYRNEDNFLVEEMKSSGVGLALTKSLVETHKGTIEVESSPGKGSTFLVKLPCKELAYAENLVEKTTFPLKNGLNQKIAEEFLEVKSIDVKPEKKVDNNHEYSLLIVDDNDELRSVIRSVLNQEYTIIEATNGAEALKIIRDHAINLVVSDVIMPEMNGYDLCKIIKEDINTCHIPVILLTAMGNIENRIKGLEIGADSYIPKPFHPRHLLTRIAKLLQAQEQIRSVFRNAPWKLKTNAEGLIRKDQTLVFDLMEFINENINDPTLDSDLLTSQFGMSKTQLYRKVKVLTGFTPHGFIKHSRLEKATELLKNTDKTVSEIIYETGFNNRTYFYRSFKEAFKCSPKDFRNGN